MPDRLELQGLLAANDFWNDRAVHRFGSVTIGVKASQTGRDIMRRPKAPVARIRGVVDAIRKGEVPANHLDQAVGKLLARVPSKLVNIAVQKPASDLSPNLLAARLTAGIPVTQKFKLERDMDPAIHDAALSAAKQADPVTASPFCHCDKFGDAAPVCEKTSRPSIESLQRSRGE